MKKAGGDVEVIVKEGWHHDFYADTPARECKDCVHFNKCEIHAPKGWIMNDEGFISESQYDVFKKVFKSGQKTCYFVKKVQNNLKRSFYFVKK